MKIMHRVSMRLTSRQRRELELLGMKVPTGLVMPGGGDPLVSMDISEDETNWSSLSALFEKWGCLDVVSTKFTKKEIQEANWLSLMIDRHDGYPQPSEGEFGFREITYDLSMYCDRCGVGLNQKESFQMKGEPTWGKNGILQMNWVFDEYFVSPSVWNSVFRPFGVQSCVVTDTKGKELKTVVQLVVKEEVSIVDSDLKFVPCSSCGRIKYLPIMRGLFPRFFGEPSVHIVKTREYFGSGASAHRVVLISQSLAKAMLEAKVLGVSFAPVEHG